MSPRQNLLVIWLPAVAPSLAVGALVFWELAQADPLAGWNLRLALAVVVASLALAGVAGGWGTRLLERLVRERTQEVEDAAEARERAEAALDDREQSLASTLDSIRDAIVVTDAQGRIARLNGAAADLAGCPGSDVLGRPMREVFPLFDPETREPISSGLELALASPDSLGFGSDALLVLGARELRVSETCCPINSRTGKLLGAVAVLRDVGREHALLEQLREANRLETVRQLAGGLAHDFNNLLAAIMGNAELMRVDGNETDRLALDEIVRASQRASNLTQQLLAFSRDGGTEFEQIDVHELIESVLAPLAGRAPRIAIERSFGAGSARIQGDPLQLARSLQSACDNALEAMPAGGTLHVQTRVVVPDRERLLRHPDLSPTPHLEVRLRDTGVGMPGEVRRRAFEPFFTTKRAPGSAGLGLASAYGSIRSHGGAVAIESEPGEGTTLTMLLPLSLEPRVSRPAPEPARHLGRVLIVDDDDGVRTLASRALELLGFPVATCDDGTQALDFFAKHHRDLGLVLLDLSMPRLGGEGVFERMREIDASVPVVIVSGYVQSPKAQRLLERGARSVLWKPFHIDELERTVRQYVARPGD